MKRKFEASLVILGGVMSNKNDNDLMSPYFLLQDAGINAAVYIEA